MPEPADHHMTMLTDVDIGSGSVRFAKDYVGRRLPQRRAQPHRRLLARRLRGRALRREAGQLGDRERRPGRCDRRRSRTDWSAAGVLLDVPRTRGVPWIEPGEHVFGEDLEAAERDQGLVVGTGDILLVRTGHARRLAELGPWDTGKAKAGLHPTTASFLADREVAALGSDGNSDTAPSTTEGVAFPMHVLAINAMGVPPARLPPVRRRRAALRGGRALGVPVCRRSAADRRRNRIAPEPHRDLLSVVPRTPMAREGGEEARIVGEPRWPMAAAVVAAIVLTILLPRDQRLLPAWVLPVIEGILLVALIAGDPGAIDRRSRLLRGLSIALVSILVLSCAGGDGEAHRRPHHGRRSRRTPPAICSRRARSSGSATSSPSRCSTGSSTAVARQRAPTTRARTPTSPSRSR